MIMEENSKEIVINKDSLVIDIQSKFTSFYPFLKIEFLTKAKKYFSFRNNKVNPESKISKITDSTFPVKLDVGPERTIVEIEEDCQALLGLTMQVSRKSGNVWNAISLTDNWTLRSQNEAAEFICTEMAPALG